MLIKQRYKSKIVHFAICLPSVKATSVSIAPSSDGIGPVRLFCPLPKIITYEKVFK